MRGERSVVEMEIVELLLFATVATQHLCDSEDKDGYIGMGAQAKKMFESVLPRDPQRAELEPSFCVGNRHVLTLVKIHLGHLQPYQSVLDIVPALLPIPASC